jgi:hypothetical protein
VYIVLSTLLNPSLPSTSITLSALLKTIFRLAIGAIQINPLQ